MGPYADALLAFYRGEVAGEAFYAALTAAARDETERLKWTTLPQLETETKAWLRAPLLGQGGVEERAADRAAGLYDIEEFRALPWAAQIREVHDSLANKFVPLYERYAAEARERGKPAEETVCRFMVDHETAQPEVARRDLADAGVDHALEPVARLLGYPLT